MVLKTNGYLFRKLSYIKLFRSSTVFILRFMGSAATQTQPIPHDKETKNFQSSTNPKTFRKNNTNNDNTNMPSPSSSFSYQNKDVLSSIISETTPQILKDHSVSSLRAILNKTKSIWETQQENPIPLKYSPKSLKSPGKSNLDDAQLIMEDKFALRRAILAHDEKTAWQLYRMKAGARHHLLPDDHTSMLGLLSRFYATITAAAHASKVKYNMRSQHIPLDHRDYIFLMTIHYRNNNDVARVMECFQEAAEIDKVEPNIHMYCLMLKSLSEVKQLRRCIELYDDMLHRYISAAYHLDARAIMIEAYAKCGDLSSAESLFEDYLKIKRNHPDNPWFGGIVDHVIMYNAMLRSYGMCGEKKKAEALYNQLLEGSKNEKLAFDNSIGNSVDREDSVKPNLSTFDAMLECYLNPASYGDAQDIWMDLIKWCSDQSKQIFMEKGQFEMASQISYQMFAFPKWSKYKDSLCRLPWVYSSSPNTISGSYSSKANTTELYQTLSSSFHPSSPSFNISASTINHHSSLHSTAHRHLKQSLIFPSPSSYLKLMKIASKDPKQDPKESWKQVLCIFSSCNQAHTRLEVQSYEQVIESLLRSGQDRLAFTWYQGILEKGYQPVFHIHAKMKLESETP